MLTFIGIAGVVIVISFILFTAKRKNREKLGDSHAGPQDPPELKGKSGKSQI